MLILTQVVYGILIALLCIGFTFYMFGLVFAAPFLILIKNYHKHVNHDTFSNRKLQNV